jgi:hypothetical protein
LPQTRGRRSEDFCTDACAIRLHANSTILRMAQILHLWAPHGKARADAAYPCICPHICGVGPDVRAEKAAWAFGHARLRLGGIHSVQAADEEGSWTKKGRMTEGTERGGWTACIQQRTTIRCLRWLRLIGYIERRGASGTGGDVWFAAGCHERI